MKKNLVIAVRAALVTLVATGLAYPLVVTGLAEVLFPGRAAGSFVPDERHETVGSELIGQPFARPAYFQSRPSAAGDKGYDPTSSGGSNLGPTSKKLRETVRARAAQLRAENPEAAREVPVELVTASASGLDPHLSPEAVLWQVPRVARARQVTTARVAAVIGEVAEGRDLGFLGEPRVNVLLLNLALDRHFGRPSSAAPAAASAAAPSEPAAKPE